MKEIYHVYPVTTAQEILKTGLEDEFLRDEIYSQLVKQTINNSSEESLIYAWKLLYLCILSFPPSFKPLEKNYVPLHYYLVSHIASRAHRELPKDKRKDNEEHHETISYLEIATQCAVKYVQIYIRTLNEGSPLPTKELTMEKIIAVTQGNFEEEDELQNIEYELE